MEDYVEMRDIDNHKFLIPPTQVHLFERMNNRMNDSLVLTNDYDDAYRSFWEQFEKYAI